jgi:3-oxoacyl-[acyl-carrier protein] reductase
VSGELRNRVVALTGAGSGLGLLTARALLERGATVLANHRSAPERLEPLRAEFGARLELVPGDVSDEAAAVALADAARARGRLDVLVHNAGVTRDRPLISMTPEEWDDVMRVNLRGAFLTTKHALRVMMRRRYGRLIYVSSVVAMMGNAGQANYAASKGGLHGLSNAVAQEYATRGIRSVVLAPGMLDTGLAMTVDQRVQQTKAARSLLGVGPAASVAATVAFLASPQADYINATVVRSDGGLAY